MSSRAIITSSSSESGGGLSSESGGGLSSESEGGVMVEYHGDAEGGFAYTRLFRS